MGGACVLYSQEQHAGKQTPDFEMLFCFCHLMPSHERVFALKYFLAFPWGAVGESGDAVLFPLHLSTPFGMVLIVD